MLSVFVGRNSTIKKEIQDFWQHNDLNNSNFVNKLNIKQTKLESFLRTDYNNPTLLKEALDCQPNNTKSRVKIWKENTIIIDENGVVSDKTGTITTKQDRHPNSGNLYFNPKNNKSRFRFLTPRECFLLMGFDEEDYEKLIKEKYYTRTKSLFFSRDVLYKLSGNSIVVNVLEQVFDQMLKIDKIINNNSCLRRNPQISYKDG